MIYSMLLVSVISFILGFIIHGFFATNVDVKTKVISTTTTPGLITTNPPAREVALANRKRLRSQELEYAEKKLIEQINEGVKYGLLERHISMGYCDLWQTKLSYFQVNLAAARKLRKAGFQVKVKTKRANKYYNSNIGVTVDLDTEQIVNKTIIISWK